MKITFIGTASCVPGKNEEVASFVVNDHFLVDTGWCNVLKLEDSGIDVNRLEYLYLTHLHQDHYLGLPQLLFYLAIKKIQGTYPAGRTFKIIGPSRHIEAVVEAAVRLLQINRFPSLRIKLEIIPLSPGKTYKSKTFSLETIPAGHSSGDGNMEEAFISKFTERSTGKAFVFTGDTHYHPPVADFAKGLPVLIHDACHTSAEAAAEVAQKAGVNKLFLIHAPSKEMDKIIKAARKIFPSTFPAVEKKIIEI
ncbi:MAG: MBL fold metallo-hydrolase [Victivallaceae bacterium]|nr:MBL fold metallo-hydrolase [Victivallaceae bacterium]